MASPVSDTSNYVTISPVPDGNCSSSGFMGVENDTVVIMPTAASAHWYLWVSDAGQHMWTFLQKIQPNPICLLFFCWIASLIQARTWTLAFRMEPASRLPTAHKVLTARTGTRRSFGFSVQRTALPMTIVFPSCDFESQQVLSSTEILHSGRVTPHYFSKYNFLYTYKLEGSGSLTSPVILF